MKKNNVASVLGLTVFATALFFSCTKEVKSGPNFIYKPAPSKEVAAKYKGQDIKVNEVFRGAETEIFEAEMKVYEIKMAKLKAWLIERMIEADPNKKDLSNDEFLKKYIAKEVTISEKEIQAFIKERSIPTEHINDQMKQRIKQFLTMEAEKGAIESWFDKQTQNNPVEVYIAKPIRPVFSVQVGDAPFVGKADAKVTIVEFSDFQCPFCQKGAGVMEEVKKKYGNKVKIAFKNYPLPFHNNAKTAANAGLCANEQGVNFFWKMHDQMFANQGSLTAEGLVGMAKKIGLKEADFKTCLESNKFAVKVESDIKEGQDVGVKSTPTFFVNGKMISGAVPLEQFSEVIDQEMSM